MEQEQERGRDGSGLDFYAVSTDPLRDLLVYRHLLAHLREALSDDIIDGRAGQSGASDLASLLAVEATYLGLHLQYVDDMRDPAWSPGWLSSLGQD